MFRFVAYISTFWGCVSILSITFPLADRLLNVLPQLWLDRPYIPVIIAVANTFVFVFAYAHTSTETNIKNALGISAAAFAYGMISLLFYIFLSEAHGNNRNFPGLFKVIIVTLYLSIFPCLTYAFTSLGAFLYTNRSAREPR